MSNYDDILHRNRPTSRHPKMHRQDRAKIFAPFDALTGLGKAVAERGRVLVTKVSMTEEPQCRLDKTLKALVPGELVTVVYFVPVRQTGDEVLGEYATRTDRVVRVDTLHQVLVLGSGEILFDDIAELLTERDLD